MKNWFQAFAFSNFSLCRYVADKEGFGVVEKFVGHGVGQEFHSGPTVGRRTTTPNLRRAAPHIFLRLRV